MRVVLAEADKLLPAQYTPSLARNQEPAIFVPLVQAILPKVDAEMARKEAKGVSWSKKGLEDNMTKIERDISKQLTAHHSSQIPSPWNEVSKS